jgi:hypothetical protein
MGIEVTGVVEKVGSKDINTKRGVSKVYSFCVDGEWYKTGFDNPNLERGYQVKFEYTEGQYGKDVNMETLKKKQGEAPKVSQGKSAGGYQKKGGPPKEDYVARDKYWAQKEINDGVRQNTISYQAATNTAVDIIKVALDQDALSLGSKKADKLDNLVAIVLKVADELYGQYLNADDRAATLKEGMETDDSDIEVDDTPPPAPETEHATTEDGWD